MYRLHIGLPLGPLQLHSVPNQVALTCSANHTA